MLMVSNDFSNAQTEEEHEFVKLMKVYNNLKNDDITICQMLSCMKILDLKPIIDEFEGLIMWVKFSSEDFSLIKLTHLFSQSLKMKLPSRYSLELAFILFNAMLVKNRYVPIVFPRSYLMYLEKMIHNEVTNQWLYSTLSSIKSYSNKYLQKYSKLSKSDLVSKIRSKETELIERFNIKELWLYGSFARDSANAYSDVDLLANFIKGYSCNNQLIEYLQKLFDRRVDVLDVKHYYKDLSIEPLKERELILDAIT